MSSNLCVRHLRTLMALWTCTLVSVQTWSTLEQWKKPWLVMLYRGLRILPNYMGIIINHYKDPYQPTRIQWNVKAGFFSWLTWRVEHFFQGDFFQNIFPGSLIVRPSRRIIERLLSFLNFQKKMIWCMGVSKNSGTPKSSILIGFSMK